MQIFVFGNPDLPEDSLPLMLLPSLKERFPEVDFAAVDPNEEWEVPEETVLIDTVLGIGEVKIFRDLDSFQSPPRLTMHDFDALSNLKLLYKLGKIKNLKIIAVPPAADPELALSKISDYIETLI